ncbi:hypothetical protein [Streptomyces sp. NPDC050485]|uniref:hypothetical protein n=1 Tax=Streptomyces sp. NPDC050485 TaxID=3365617 RepID=UPI0037AB583E
MPEEVGDFFEGAAGGELLDRIAAVGKGVGLLDDGGDLGGVDKYSGKAAVDVGGDERGGGHGAVLQQWVRAGRSGVRCRAGG